MKLIYVQMMPNMKMMGNRPPPNITAIDPLALGTAGGPRGGAAAPEPLNSKIEIVPMPILSSGGTPKQPLPPVQKPPTVITPNTPISAVLPPISNGGGSGNAPPQMVKTITLTASQVGADFADFEKYVLFSQIFEFVIVNFTG